MKNSFYKLLILFILSQKSLLADSLNISAKNITLDKKLQITIFENEVLIKDKQNNTIKSEYAKYDKNKNFIILKRKIVATDKFGNKFFSDNATYDEKLKVFKSIGSTKILTKEGYSVDTQDVILNNKENFVFSEKETLIKDVQGNFIYLENFNYKIGKNIFKSIGLIKLKDNLNNSYEFSQIYIDEKKREMIGTDSKVYLNQDDFKDNIDNKPRVFSNTINIKDEELKFIKSTFTMCDYREGDKCPPWELSASEMRHDKIKKTIYYDNAVIRVYNIPIFYFPKLAHPDPTVDRRSGFLNPTYSDTKNLGSSITVPYFWAIRDDRDFTINNRLFASEHPLFLGEYRHAFKNSDLIFNFGFTEGYKNTSSTKKAGEKSHFFSKFVKKFETDEGIDNNLELNIQHVSNKKYLKLYKIDSNLVNYETDTLENYLDFNRFDDNKNLFLGIKASSFRTLRESYNDKYENILPELVFNKNLFSEKYGYGNFQTNFKIHNYDTNKYKNFLINDLEWELDHTKSQKIYDGKIITKLKNVNYDVKNESKFKENTTSELFGAVGYLASIDYVKSKIGNINHLLRPKVLFKYAPNHMRKDEGDYNLHNKDIFTLDRLNVNENFESGTNLTYGVEYEIDSPNNQTNFSIGQVINEKKNNKKMPDSSSLDNRFSDVVGNFSFKNSNSFKLNYNYSIDQNLKEMNYSEIGAKYDLNDISFSFDYLLENKVNSDDKEYVKTEINFKNFENSIISFSNKRNLITNSSEYYNLSYEYLNDCLRAGIVYRREFYNDSELEAENSLMFKITLNSFGALNSPSFSQ